MPGSPALGFVAVNKQPITNGVTNGRPAISASPSVRAELETLFANIRDGVIEGSPPAVPRPHVNKSKTKPSPIDETGLLTAPVAIPNTPHNLVNLIM